MCGAKIGLLKEVGGIDVDADADADAVEDDG
jgi:hypothetical protein